MEDRERLKHLFKMLPELIYLFKTVISVLLNDWKISNLHVKMIVQTKPYVVETWNLEGW